MKREGLKIFWFLSLFFLPLAATPLRAQSFWPASPQADRTSRFRWEGVVDGTAIIRVRRRQIAVENVSGSPVQRQRYDFTDPLPTSRVDLRLVVVEGRGRVRLIQEPRADNDYVAAVRIEDDQGGRSFYSFELLWSNRDWRDDDRRDRGDPRRDDDEWRPQRERYREVEFFAWRGRVDGESIIRIRGDEVRVQTISGGGVRDERYRFSSPLPSQEFQVNLVDAEGRGEVVLIEQPSSFNNYITSVRIRDRRGGAGDYSFALTWRRQTYRDRPRDDNWNNTTQRSLRWSGRVDGRDLLRIRGDRLWIDHETGAPILGADYRFDRPLPSERRIVSVRKLHGRGTVRVIDQPSRDNGYTATILIEDRDGGSDQYEIEVSW